LLGFLTEIRLDIDPAVQPDITASITDMHPIESESMDALYSSHNIEHLYPHEVELALREFRRVLKTDGYALITCPDIQIVARHIAEGRLEDTLYTSPAGPIAPIDILYGHRPSLARGNLFMAHKTGFTAQSLGNAIISAGFVKAQVKRDEKNFNLWARAYKRKQ
jgi:SAM-dependent methyltransferase